LQLAAGCVQQASGKGANRLAAHNDTATWIYGVASSWMYVVIIRKWTNV
jgi:hypothetical protein